MESRKQPRLGQSKSLSEDRENSKPRVSVIFSVKNVADDLSAVLAVFESQSLQVVHVESRKSRKRDNEYEIFADVENVGGVNLREVFDMVKSRVTSIYVPTGGNKSMTKTVSLDKGDTKYTDDGIPWFPRHVSDLDLSSNRVMMYGDELDADHPGFKDEVYRTRRKEFAEIAFKYRYGQPIPRIQYTEEEVTTWGTIFRELNKLYPTHACEEYLANLPLLRQYCGYSEHAVPQLDDISRYLKEKTGFTLRPVAGYLSSRDFLSGLAFRVFHCTQYIRHSSDPFYTPEPDCCHELLGHMPLFLDPSFAEFSQEIGLASLGASDEEVEKLSTCYFFTVEFGLCRQQGQFKVYGAGLLSSAGELKHVLSDEATIKPFEPSTTCTAECRITTFQDAYYYTDTFEEAKDKLRAYARTIKRPFELAYDPYTNNVRILDKTAEVAKVLDDLSQKLLIVTSAVQKITQS